MPTFVPMRRQCVELVKSGSRWVKWEQKTLANVPSTSAYFSPSLTKPELPKVCAVRNCGAIFLSEHNSLSRSSFHSTKRQSPPMFWFSGTQASWLDWPATSTWPVFNQFYLTPSNLTPLTMVLRRTKWHTINWSSNL